MVHQVGRLALVGDQSLGPSTQIVAQALQNSSPRDIQFPFLAAGHQALHTMHIHACKQTTYPHKVNSIKFQSPSRNPLLCMLT